MFCPLFNTRFKLLLSFQEEQGVDHGKLAAIVLYHQQWLALAEAWSLMLAVLCLNCAAVLAFKGVVCGFNIIQFLVTHFARGKDVKFTDHVEIGHSYFLFRVFQHVGAFNRLQGKGCW